METIIDQQLSDELQDMFLQNKLWLSDILFYEDEVRFFRNMFDKAFSQALNDNHLNQVQHIDSEITALKNYLDELKNMVLDHGRIVQRGTHAELIEQSGLYRTIYDLQLKDQEAVTASVA